MENEEKEENVKLKKPNEVNKKLNPEEKYPWHLLSRTMVLLNAFLVLGVIEAVFGPTLLDLKDIFGVSIGRLSFIMLLSSVGSMFGCFVAGLLFDRFKKFQYLYLAGSLLTMSLPIIVLPYLPSIILAYILSSIKGFASGALDTGGNVLILKIWNGRDSGPYMHALHFTFGLGAFLAPVISRPFLYNAENLDKNEVLLASGNNETSEIELFYQEETWTIKALYPILGVYAILASFGFFLYFFKDIRKEQSSENSTDTEESKKEEVCKNQMSSNIKIILVGIMSSMFFFYVGMEVAFGTYISVFAVKSNLKFTRPQGSDVTAIFWGTFAATRGLAILLAIVAKPALVMWGSYAVCILGAILLSIFANSSSAVLYFGTALMGIGMASIFATGFLWMEQRIAITSKISACLVISSGLGAKVFPLLVGQLVEEWPMMLHYLSISIVAGCCLMFGLANIIFFRKSGKPVSILKDESNNKVSEF